MKPWRGLLFVAMVAVNFTVAIAPLKAGGPQSDEDRMLNVGFFGFVRDLSGAAVADAKVIANYTTRKIKLIARSDATGAYAITKLGDNTDPKTVIITCEKDGFRFDTLAPRNLEPKPGQPDEIDCILAKP